MKNSGITFLISLFIIFSGCNKDDSNSAIPDCEKNNYGVIKASFGATNAKHGILITAVGGSSIVRDKIVEAGKATDTIRLAPGFYNINIASLNNSNLVIQDQNFTNRSVDQCLVLDLQVTF